eukprot:TRINITY_DN5693_c0_g1_i3.p6 TRINITY_DN5693_c0_g1~~TRINITY_DN5693_c0_g1_i3.p6  ORF type:complete len:140 (-),score=13.23 TRINITY_DN5693_c0_g1_i3:1249-1668(-)
MHTIETAILMMPLVAIFVTCFPIGQWYVRWIAFVVTALPTFRVLMYRQMCCKQEIEADLLGMKLMGLMGFKPKHYVQYLRYLKVQRDVKDNGKYRQIMSMFQSFETERIESAQKTLQQTKIEIKGLKQKHPSIVKIAKD